MCFLNEVISDIDVFGSLLELSRALIVSIDRRWDLLSEWARTIPQAPKPNFFFTGCLYIYSTSVIS